MINNHFVLICYCFFLKKTSNLIQISDIVFNNFFCFELFYFVTDRVNFEFEYFKI